MENKEPWHGADFVRRSEWFPIFNSRQIGTKNLLTNRAGDWDILSRDEYDALFVPLVRKDLVLRLAERNLVLFDGNANLVLDSWKSFNAGLDENGPQLHIIHLTQRCNLGCTYCHSAAIPLEANGRDLSVERAEKIAQYILQMPARNIGVNFQGGEPTLMPDLIRQIMTTLVGASTKKIKASITTNGTLLTDEILSVLREFSISITVSLDGPRETHNKIRVFRDGSGSFDAAIAARNLINSDKSLRLNGSVMVITKHSKTNVRSIIDEYVRQGQSSMHLKAVTKLGFGKSNWDDMGLDFEEYWECYEDALNYMLSLQDVGLLISETQVKLALEMVVDRKKPGHVDARNPCGLVYGV